jgi:hypothetical protein
MPAGTEGETEQFHRVRHQEQDPRWAVHPTLFALVCRLATQSQLDGEIDH